MVSQNSATSLKCQTTATTNWVWTRAWRMIDASLRKHRHWLAQTKVTWILIWTKSWRGVLRLWFRRWWWQLDTYSPTCQTQKIKIKTVKIFTCIESDRTCWCQAGPEKTWLTRDHNLTNIFAWW
jgi:hypothetical protein